MTELVHDSTSLFDEANNTWDSGNKKLAPQLFLEAARQGEKYAFNSVGYFFDHGIGTKIDPARAYSWYRRAAARGDVAAYTNLAIWYRDAGNSKRSKFWFEKAHLTGDGSATYELGKIYLAQKRSSNNKKALQYLTAASKSKYIDETEKKEVLNLLLQLKSKNHL